MYRGVHSIGFLKMEIAQNKKLGKILLRKATFGGESAHVNQQCFCMELIKYDSHILHMKMYTNVRFARSPEAKVTGQVPGDLSFLTGPPARPQCTVAPGEAGPEHSASGFPRKANNLDFSGSFPIFQTLFGSKQPHSQASRFYLCRELRTHRAVFQPHQVDRCIRRGAAISKCLICSQTLCNIIKSFPHHTHHLANTKINKTEQNELCQK